MSNNFIPDIKIEKIYPDAKIPTRAYETDSGLDLYAYTFKKIYVNSDPEEVPPEQTSIILQPNDRILVDTGIKATVGSGYEIQIRPRSGYALKKGITVLNTPGTIDESYRGMIGVILINLSNNPTIVNKNDKIAQMVVCPVILSTVKVIPKLPETDRGAKGFGHSGN